MPSSEAPISINLKTPAGTQITLRAETPDEFTALTSAIFQVVEAVGEVETAVRGANAAVPPAPATAAIAAAFNATVIDTQPSAIPGSGARQCPHGTMTRIHGLTGKFGPYKGHFCPAKQNDQTKCTTVYVKAGSPEFATFIADQTKA